VEFTAKQQGGATEADGDAASTATSSEKKEKKSTADDFFPLGMVPAAGPAGTLHS
jgi:hypothetical protein